MCGIVALLTPDPTAPDVLDEMRDRLVHRGPDVGISQSYDADGWTLSFGHRRLSIIDLSREADQPMVGPGGSTVVVYNGEIYNYVELRDELRGRGHSFHTRSDTEVLLAAYAEWGTDCLSRLNGMFAFALWDRRSNTLFVARDRFGEKPLFHTRLPLGGVAFASEMKALFAHPDCNSAPDPEMVAAFAEGRYHEDGERTLFRGVTRVAPAHALVLDRRGDVVKSWRYWTPDYAPNGGCSQTEAAERLRELLERSIRMRLRSDVPVGTSLSGGLDSSSIVGLLAQMRESAPRSFTQNTFSGRYDGVDPALDEGPQIDAVVRDTGVHAFRTSPMPEGLIEESEQLHWHQEEPFLSASIYMQWCVMRLAATHRTTVLLDGQGADELLAGYQYYFSTHQLDLLEQRRYARLVAETIAFRRRLRRASKQYPDARRRFNPEIALTFPRVIAKAILARNVYSSTYTVGVPDAVRGGRLRRQLAEGLQYSSLPALLRYADRNGMAFARETRFPFLDHDIVDWAVSLPDEILVADGWQKYVLRRAVEGVVPQEIQWRADKVGYAAPLDLWLRAGLKQWACNRLFDGPITGLASYDASAVRALWNAHQEGVAENSWALWRWISLNEWFGLIESDRWRRGFSAAGPQVTVRAG
jgi:asparagine synthase (glutamine-hydrolysing)